MINMFAILNILKYSQSVDHLEKMTHSLGCERGENLVIPLKLSELPPTIPTLFKKSKNVS